MSANAKTRPQLTPTAIPKLRPSRIEEAIASSGVPGHEQHRPLGVQHDLVAHTAKQQLGHLSAASPPNDYQPGLLLVCEVQDHRGRPPVLKDRAEPNARSLEWAAPLGHKALLDLDAHLLVEEHGHCVGSGKVARHIER